MSILQTQLTAIKPSAVLTDDKIKKLLDPDAYKGVPVGISGIDKLILGIKPGFYLLSAARGTGKTWFSLQLAKNLWQNSKMRSVFFSLEMPTDHLLQRCLQSWSGLTEGEFLARKDTSKGQALLNQDFFTIVPAYEGAFEYEHFAATVERYAQEGYKLFILDHLHLVRGASSKDSLEELTHWANEIKKLSARLKITCFIIAQPRKLNNPTKIVTSDDIKGSGSIGDAADVILTLSRERADLKAKQERKCWFSVEKNRLGGQMYEGVALYFTETGEFKEVDLDREEGSDGSDGKSDQRLPALVDPTSKQFQLKTTLPLAPLYLGKYQIDADYTLMSQYEKEMTPYQWKQYVDIRWNYSGESIKPIIN